MMISLSVLSYPNSRKIGPTLLEVLVKQEHRIVGLP